MRRTLLPWLCGFAAIAATLLTPGMAAASDTHICKGTAEHPGILTGNVHGDVSVSGVCFVAAGPATVDGSVTVRDGAVLAAVFGLHDSSLTVTGNVRVQRGATAFLGCEPGHATCLDDPKPNDPTLSSHDHIGGSLISWQPLGVIVHNFTIDHNVVSVGGGGGFTCEPSGVFKAVLHSPVFSAYEDGTVGGRLSIRDMHSCWLGVARAQIGKSAWFVDNQFADPDAIEIISNHVGGDLACFRNSMVWDSVEAGAGLFPRMPTPNTVEGKRLGQCELSSPVTEHGPRGPGPF